MNVPMEEVLFRCEPQGEPAPFVVEVPRSGTLYPRDFRAVAPFDVVHSAVSMYVDELFAGTPAAGGTLLVARFPNVYIDANRGLDDLDPDMIEGVWLQPLAQTQKKSLGVGLVRRLAKAGVPMYDRKLTVDEVEHRIHHYHEPYHEELAGILEAQRRRFGSAFHISCHCMNAIGSEQTPDPGRERPDFCIGDQDGTTSGREFTEFVVETLRGRGFRVTVNDPYKGAECVRRHGAPAQGVHSLQIETCKRLFMHEKTFLRSDGFQRLREELDRLLAAVAGFARRHARSKA
jgi:N-formylglutamate deformylase